MQKVHFNAKMIGATQRLIDAMYDFKKAARSVKWDDTNNDKEVAFDFIEKLDPVLTKAEQIMAARYRVVL